ncbi:aminotransferase class V-fold PLP-dependent enzyme [Corynebacterium sp. TAE3-ERU12]|uniref:aminotransferase class V-fold PLP-dependent enzyme n=1 Tax=Corynebacterium sp. TAE3-ERU12 TaxID=2849491 RepID=UPI001C45E56B|nr:aminotransferase class V-fold PLP-dependent enzyme [Corynebacterium sp. TAE3-ERU12]MBV7294421.1 aminotransferase class V-fold PLP-dependent enzyme [Corynebacterium sp. TAE3-ERU12]
MAFDVPTTRGYYTSLSDGWTYLNGLENAQIPERVSAAVASSFRNAPKKLKAEASSGVHARSQEAGVSASGQMAMTARRAFADMVGARSENVVLGPSRHALVEQLMTGMSRRLTLGSEVVLSRTGRPAVRVPVQRAADMFGATERMAEADLSTGELPSWQYTELVNSRTRLVVVPAADPHVGTVAPVRDIATTVHRAAPDAWVLVDATDYAPYRLVDMAQWDADIVLIDAAVWGGPDVAALVFRDNRMLDRLMSLALSRGAKGAHRLEVAGVAPGLLGGVAASVQCLAELDPSSRGTRRRRLEVAMPQISDYLTSLTAHLMDSLEYLPRVHIVGGGSEDSGYDSPLGPAIFSAVPRALGVDRVPRVSFIVGEGAIPAADVVRRLMNNGVVTSSVQHGDSALLEAMGVFEANGAVAVGLQPFNTSSDIDQLVRGVASLG